MDKNLGLGVMLGMLGGNRETVEVHKESMGKNINKIDFDETALLLYFDDGSGIKIYDDGQSCCEDRYLHTDDNLQYYVGSKFIEAELRDAPPIKCEYGEHEVQFLIIKTSLGEFTIETHNEHHGYYGGFWIGIDRIKS